MPKTKRASSKNNGGPLGFEEKLWAAADKLRGHMDAAAYKNVVIGLIFLKYISHAFEVRHVHLLKETADAKSEYYVKELKSPKIEMSTLPKMFSGFRREHVARIYKRRPHRQWLSKRS